MRVFAILFLSCVSMLAAETNAVRLMTMTTTNESGAIKTKDVFTRGGQTNLVRNTSTKDGVVLIRVHRLYHGGSLVGILSSTPDSSSTTSWAGCPYAVDFEYGPTNQLKHAAIISQEGVLVDAFACTNGILFPVPSSELGIDPQMAADVKALMSRDRKRSPEEFRREAERLVEKYDK